MYVVGGMYCGNYNWIMLLFDSMHNCNSCLPSFLSPVPIGELCVSGEGVGGEEVDVCELLRRVQEHVLVNRIRVSEYFQDFDPLRSGVISNQRFRQVGDGKRW